MIEHRVEALSELAAMFRNASYAIFSVQCSADSGVGKFRRLPADVLPPFVGSRRKDHVPGNPSRTNTARFPKILIGVLKA